MTIDEPHPAAERLPRQRSGSPRYCRELSDLARRSVVARHRSHAMKPLLQSETFRAHRGAARGRACAGRGSGTAAAARSDTGLSVSRRRATSSTTLVKTGPSLLRALLITLRVTLRRVRRCRCAGNADRLHCSCKAGHRGQPVPLRGAAAGHADRRDRAADHHLVKNTQVALVGVRDASSRFSRSSPTPRWACAASNPGSPSCSA